MNISRILYVMMICLFMFAGCHSKKNEQSNIFYNNQIITSTNDTEVFRTVSHDNGLEKIIELNEFWIGEGKFDNISLIGTDIQVKYPQISDYSNKKIQDKINKTIYESVIISNHLAVWNSMPVKADITYEITFIDGNIFSILFSGYISNGSYYNFEYAMTFDLQSGQEVDVFNFFSEEEIFSSINSCMDTRKCTVYPKEFWEDSSNQEILKEYFLDSFQKFDNHSNDFFIRKNKIVLMVSLLPLKDYAFLEIDLNSTPSLKTVN